MSSPEIVPAGKLNWNVSVDPKVVDYILYQMVEALPDRSSPQVSVGRVGEAILPVPGLPLVESEEVYYGVSAVDQRGNKSPITSIVVDIDVTAPPAPTGLVYIP